MITVTETIKEMLEKLNACNEARLWASNYTDPQTAWDACERGDWMLWYLGRTAVGAQDSDKHL